MNVWVITSSDGYDACGFHCVCEDTEEALDEGMKSAMVEATRSMHSRYKDTPWEPIENSSELVRIWKKGSHRIYAEKHEVKTAPKRETIIETFGPLGRGC